ncbi:MFS transporter [Escherichia coli]
MRTIVLHPVTHFSFISWSLWWSLYAIWLKGHLGLTGTELGTLYSVNQFTSILFMMFYGIIPG